MKTLNEYVEYLQKEKGIESYTEISNELISLLTLVKADAANEDFIFDTIDFNLVTTHKRDDWTFDLHHVSYEDYFGELEDYKKSCRKFKKNNLKYYRIFDSILSKHLEVII